MSPEIRILPSEVIDQIAAGEVVERPSHLVKELVENAIDAGATRIEVSVSSGGRQVLVKDDGSGIGEKDLPLAFKRHATSKIQLSSDLFRLSSFGFRGEALASIGAVSQLQVRSRKKGTDQAYELYSRFGDLSKPTKCGGEEGTTIQVEDLFSNVPARLKFLKSETAENSQIKTMVKDLSLANPNCGFQLRLKGQLVFHTEPGELRERVKEVLEIKDLCSGEAEIGGYRAQVFFAAPNQTMKTSKGVRIFVQNRPVMDRSILAALMDGFQSFLMHREYPIAAIFLSCDPEDVDVNIHPTKSAVKFHQPASVYRVVKTATRNGLDQGSWVKDLLSPNFSSLGKNRVTDAGAGFSTEKAQVSTGPSKGHLNSQSKSESEDSGGAVLGEGSSSHSQSELEQASFSGDMSFQKTQFPKKEFVLREPGAPQKDFPQAKDWSNLSINQSLGQQAEGTGEGLFGTSSEDSETASAPESSLFSDQMVSGSGYSLSNESSGSFAGSEESKHLKSWSSLDLIGQAHLTYLVCQNDQSLILIDQHAAHERVAFERLFRAWNKGKIEVQNFLLPLAIELEATQIELLAPHLEDLEALGITAQILESQIEVSAAPVIVKESALRKALEEFAIEIEKSGGGASVGELVTDICATLACHSVVRAGQALSREQMVSLLEQMDEFSGSSFCPHGRPVYVEFPVSRIEREFGRLV